MRDIGLAETRRGVGHFVASTPEVAEVTLGPWVEGRRQDAPGGGDLPADLSLLVYVVSEPGKARRVYDAATTVLVMPD